MTPTRYTGYSVLGVEKVGNEYQAMWKIPNGYWIQKVGLNGVHKGFGVALTAAQLKEQEAVFSQDFNGDGNIGGMVQPASVDTDYAGELTITIPNVPTGGKVRLDKYLDQNENGLVDAGEMLTQSLELTDGYVQVIGGVRNTSVPGDEDGVANGVIRTKYLFKVGEGERALPFGATF